MKKTSYLLLLLAITACSPNQNPEAVTQAAPEMTQEKTVYGAPFDATHSTAVQDLEAQLMGKDSMRVTLKGDIVQSCQAKGCWMDVQLPDNRTMKVTFRDYGFFLPVEDLQGRQVVFTGTALRQETSVEELRHYAQDAGKSAEEVAAITAPKTELRFVADGVILQ